MNATAELVDTRFDLEHTGLEEIALVAAEGRRDRLSLRAMLGGARLAAFGVLSILTLVLAWSALAGGAEERAAQRLSERSMEAGSSLGVFVVALGLVAVGAVLAALRSHRLHD